MAPKESCTTPVISSTWHTIEREGGVDVEDDEDDEAILITSRFYSRSHPLIQEAIRR